MNKIVLKVFSSRFVARLQLHILIWITARAFGVRKPSARGKNNEELLALYARFTDQEAERAIAYGVRMEALQQALYCEAYALGCKLRVLLRIRSGQDCMALLSVLYHNIGIRLVGQLPGKVMISECYFSQFYSPQVCHLISFLDWGIFAGLCDGGRLTFSKRITEGNNVCCASYEYEMRRNQL